MLYWPKLLITGFAITNTIEAYLPLYFVNGLQLTTVQASGLIALIYSLRLFSGVWTSIVDHRPHLYGPIISLSIIVSSIAFIELLSLSSQPFSTALIWTLLIVCAVLDGLFYQPLSTLINSAIIKILSDYRVIFYGSYVRWSKLITILTTGLIAFISNSVDDETRYLDSILISVYLIGMILLLAIALFRTTAVEPANATQLDISEEQAPLLLKNALHLTTAADHSGMAVYRPYSIFGEQLSHISEEDQSVLDRMLTTEESVRRMDSYDSAARTPSFYSESGLYYSYSRQQQFLSQQQQQLQGDEYNNYQSMTLVPTVPANALALLPISISPLDPLVAFMACFIFKSDDEDDIQEDYPQIITTKLNCWQKHTLTLTLIILGVGFGLMNTFLFVYLYSSLEISIAMISCLIMTHMTSEMIVACVIEKWFIHKLNLTLATTLGHITLILCAILYPCLKSNSILTQVSLLVLQALQASSFQLLWLSGSDQVILIHWNPLDRMKHRAKLSAAYSSIGPAIGCLLSGFILLEDSTLVYKICVALFSLSFVVSWGWTSEE